MVVAGLLTGAGNTAAEETGSSPSGKHAKTEVDDLPDLISMATELGNRLAVLEKEIAVLFDFPAAQEDLARIAKKTRRISRDIKRLKGNSHYGYDQIFNLNAQITRESAKLQMFIQYTKDAIDQAEGWKEEWMAQGMSWEQLQSSLSKQVSSTTLEPSFSKAHYVITKSQSLIARTIEPLLSQLHGCGNYTGIPMFP